MSFYVPTKFVWRFGGNQVHLCGSFTRWVETVPMTPVEGQLGTFSVVVHLPPGYHQYKFIVDGEWRHDETQPFMPDPLGNVNNWLFVRKPEGGQPSGNAAAANAAQQQLGVAPPPQHAMQQYQQQATPPDVSKPSPQTPTQSSMDTFTSQEMPSDGGVIAPIAAEAHEPEYTRKKIHEFLSSHTAYELIPESGKVVLLDVDLPIRQAFHALHEQGIASSPIYDSEAGSITGIISASDFIATLQRLRNIVSSNSNPMSEAEMDQHTIRDLREELVAEGRPPKELVYVKPQDTLLAVVKTMFDNHCSMSPVLSDSPEGGAAGINGDGPELLHTVTISGVIACLMRHFRASLGSMPLLAQPLTALPLGTWSPTSALANDELAMASKGNGVERRDRRRVAPLRTVGLHTPLTEAFCMLLEAGISCLPVVDESGLLLDIYARADITMLAKGNAYSRLQFEDVTVGQALTLASQPAPLQGLAPGQAGQWTGASPNSSATSMQDLANPGKQRVYMCTTRDTLRTVVERLSVPGVRRLIVVDPDTRRVEGIVSLSDLAAYLLM